MKFLKGLLIIAVFALQSCSKEDGYIPDVLVDFQTSTVNLDNINNSPGKVYVLQKTSVGVAGLVFYNNNGQVLAYDRCSTVNPEQRNAVVFLAGSLVEDKASGAIFDLTNGSPAKAPAVRALRRYNVSVNGNIIRVTN